MSCACEFTVKFSGSAEDLYKKVKKLIEDHGGVIIGDARGGSFSVPVPIFGTVAGTYKISGQEVTICITKKSIFLACSLIEKFVRDNVPKVVSLSMDEL